MRFYLLSQPPNRNNSFPTVSVFFKTERVEMLGVSVLKIPDKSGFVKLSGNDTWDTCSVVYFGLKCKYLSCSGMPLGMRPSSDVEYSAVGEGLGMRDFWLYVWLRRVSVVAAHIISLGLFILISILSRPGTSELFHFFCIYLHLHVYIWYIYDASLWQYLGYIDHNTEI